MGMFKDLRSMSKTAKELKKDNPSPGFREMISQGKEALESVQDQFGDSAIAEDPNARSGTAVITAIRDTGVTMNENPNVEFDLEVSSGGFTYEATHTQVVSRLQVPNLQPGTTVNVKIHPTDQDKLVIV